MKHLLLLFALLLTAAAPAPVANSPERIAKIAASRDLPGSLHPDTIEARLAPLVTLNRKPPTATQVITFTDYGLRSSDLVRRALVRFQPGGKARVQLEFAASPDLTFDKLASAIETVRGKPAESEALRKSWNAPDGMVQLFTDKGREGEDVLVLELVKG
ncbi:hypothetical protein [Roseiterribacter gracilis]|uniref:Uncharacterized protein n=1 Tax=Roseiterribacter gracilis TaxID=2812848 RepID=A0A8S8XC28_9PROT|nr:hypothetical protein TMPK1_18690 [Rhodospirillales bacterium TMPK1]